MSRGRALQVFNIAQVVYPSKYSILMAMCSQLIFPPLHLISSKGNATKDAGCFICLINRPVLNFYTNIIFTGSIWPTSRAHVRLYRPWASRYCDRYEWSPVYSGFLFWPTPAFGVRKSSSARGKPRSTHGSVARRPSHARLKRKPVRGGLELSATALVKDSWVWKNKTRALAQFTFSKASCLCQLTGHEHIGCVACSNDFIPLVAIADFSLINTRNSSAST